MSIFKLYHNKVFGVIILLLFIKSSSIISAQSEQDISAIRDSLVSTFPYLIVDSAEQARENVVQALVINKEHASIEVEAFGTYCLGFYNRIKGNNRTAIRYQNKALEMYVELDNTNKKVVVLNELGILHKNIGEYEESIKFYMQGIELAEKHQLKRLADVYSNLAVVINLLKNYDQALTYLFKSLELEEDVIGRGMILLNIGATYYDDKQDSLAMVYYNKALKVCNDNDLPLYYRNDVLHNIANALIANGEYKKGLSNLFKIKNYEELENNQRDLTFTYLSIASAYQKMNNINDAKFYLNKCIDLALETETNDQLLKAYNQLSTVYKQENSFEKSLNVYEKYVILKDSLFNIEKAKYSENLLADLEAERKENEILLLKKEKELQDKELVVNQHLVKNHKITRNVTIVIAMLLLIGAFLTIFFYRQKIKDEQLLAIKTEEVNKQEIYALLRDQEVNAIKAEVEGREKERKRIAQELHDGIGGNLASIKLNLANIISDSSDKKLQTVMRNIDDTCKEVRAISHNLLSFKITNHVFTHLINKFLEEITVGKEISLNMDFYPEEKLDMLPNELKIELYRIIQELMSNVIKYSEASNVDVQLVKGVEYVSLMVEDNGLGFDTKQITNGIGLKNIRSRIEALNGIFRIESSIGDWTLVNIEIPITKA